MVCGHAETVACGVSRGRIERIEQLTFLPVPSVLADTNAPCHASL